MMEIRVRGISSEIVDGARRGEADANGQPALGRGAEGIAKRVARPFKRRLRAHGGPSDASLDVLEEDARRFLRLGDLLWDRRRIAAAAVEYGKAHDADKQDPKKGENDSHDSCAT